MNKKLALMIFAFVTASTSQVQATKDAPPTYTETDTSLIDRIAALTAESEAREDRIKQLENEQKRLEDEIANKDSVIAKLKEQNA